MTVSSTISRSGPYMGNGVTTVFDYDFRILEDTHITVVRTVDGEDTTVSPSDYAVTGVGDANGGTVIFTLPPAAGEKITIIRNVPFVQETDLENQGEYYAETVERALDLLTMRDQQLEERLDRAVQIPVGADPLVLPKMVENIVRIADSADNIDTVADNIGMVTALAPHAETLTNNIASIETVAAQIADVETVAGNIASVTELAPFAEAITENLSDISNFGKVYLGPKPSDPATRNDGSPLQSGDLYFNTTAELMKVFTGGEWKDTAAQSLNMVAGSFVGDGETTTFTLGTAPAVAANVLVWVDGVRQVPNVDYTVSGADLIFVVAPGNGIGIDTLVIATTAVIPISDQPFFNSQAEAASALVPAGVNAVLVVGYASAGDGGGALYRRAAAEPVHAGKFQTADGTWWELAEQVATPQMFGVVAGSGTNQQAAFQAFLNFLSIADRKGYVPAGVYTFTQVLALGSGVNLELNPEAVLDFSGVPSGNTFISCAGTISASVPLAANAAGGTLTLSITSANIAALGGLAKGDMVRIGSTAVFDASSTNIPLGEIKFVQSVSGTTVTLTETLEDSYITTAAAYVAKITPVERTIIRGGKIVGNTAVEQDGSTGITFMYALRCGVTDLDISGMDNACILFIDSAFCYAERNFIHDVRPNTQGYGVSFKDATRDSWASHNVFSKVRHSLSTNNSSNPGGIPRRIKFHHNTVDASEFALGGSGAGGDAIDTHTAAEFIDITDNTVLFATGCGINVECPNATIRGNRIKYSSAHGIQVHNESDRTGGYIISGNEVIASQGKGISVYQGSRGTTAEIIGLILSNNRVVASAGGPNYEVKATVSGAYTRNVTISGNDSVGGSAQSYTLTNVRSFSVVGNTARIPAATYAPYLFIGCIGGAISGNNTVGAANSPCYYLDGGSNCVVSGNAAEGGNYGTFFSDTQTYSGIFGNVFRGYSSAATRTGSGAGNAAANNIS